MDRKLTASQQLAAAITKESSKQTFYTIRFFADRGRAARAYQAYGYFRWVDDVLDSDSGTQAEKLAFAGRQEGLLEACYRGQAPSTGLCPEENILVELVASDPHRENGLYLYLRNMMDVMVFDAGRRNRVISQAELDDYSLKLAMAVTEAMHYFIGHDLVEPRREDRYRAVTAAHITHMLRDTLEDTGAGYFNVPQEFLLARGITLQAVGQQACCEWVCSRVKLAREYFKAGRKYMAGVRSLRCRLAGYAYMARFEWMLRAIERDNYCLRLEYPERKGLAAGLWMGALTLARLVTSFWTGNTSRNMAVAALRIEEQ